MSSASSFLRPCVALATIISFGTAWAQIEWDTQGVKLINSVRVSDGDKPTSVKIIFRNGGPIVLVDIDDKKGIPLFLDTGTAQSFVYSSAVKRLGLQSRPYLGELKYKDNENLLDVDTVSFGGVSFSVHGFWHKKAIESDPDVGYCAGTIGWDFLRHLELTFDFPNGEILVENKHSEFNNLPESAAWRSLPIIDQFDKHQNSRPFVDTGARFSWMTLQSRWRELLPANSKKLAMARLMAADGNDFGTCHVFMGGEPDFNLRKDLKFANVPLIAGGVHPALSRLRVDLMLGIGILEDFKFKLSPKTPHFEILEQRPNGGVLLSKALRDSFSRSAPYRAGDLFYSDVMIREFIAKGIYPGEDNLRLVSSWCDPESLTTMLKEKDYSDNALLFSAKSAIEVGNIENLEIIFKVLQSKKITDKMGLFLWVFAVRNGQTEMLRWLEKNKIPCPDLPEDSPDLVTLGAVSGSISALKYMMDKNPRRLTAQDVQIFAVKTTPKEIRELYAMVDPETVKEAIPMCLYIACKYANWDVAGELVDEPDAAKYVAPESGVTTLMQAARHGNVEILTRLLENGAAVNAQDKERKPALAHALKGRGDAEITSILARRMAEVGTGPTLWNSSLRGVSVLGDAADLRALIDAGLKIEEAPRRYRVHSLLNAARRGSKEMVELLHTKGTLDWVESDDDGKSALILALDHRHLKLAEWIAKQEGFELAREGQMDAALLALKVGGMEVVKHFLGQLEPKDENGAETLEFFTAAYNSGEVECLDLVKEWCETHELAIPVQELEALAAEKKYRSVTEWVGRLSE